MMEIFGSSSVYANAKSGFLLLKLMEEDVSVHDFTILHTNNSFNQLIGYPSEELRNKSINSWDEEASLKQLFLQKDIYQIALDGGSKICDYQNLRTRKRYRVEIFSAEHKMIAALFSEVECINHKMQKLLLAVEQSPNAVIITDTQANIEYINKAFTLVTGYTSEEVIGRNPRFLKSGEHSELFYSEIWKNLKSGKKWQGEIKNKKKNGSTYWDFSRITPIFNEHEEITHYLAIYQDVTDKKEAQKRIRENETRYKSIIQLTQTGAWEFHASSEYLWCSEEYFTMLGYESSEFQIDGSPNLRDVWQMLMHPDDVLEASRKFSEYLSGNRKDMYENYFRMKHKNGSDIWIWSRGKAMKDDTGNPTDLIIGTHIDITAIKEAQATIEKSELYHRSLLKALPDLIFVMDRNGNFLDYKTSNEDYLILDPNHFLQKNISNLLPQEIANKQINAIKKCFENNEAVSYDYSLPVLGKETFFNAVTVTFGSDKVLVAIRNITGFQNNLSKIKQLLSTEEKLNKTLRSFTHIVSHNLRVHIANMLGILMFLEKENPDLYENQYVQMIKSAADNLDETVYDLNEALSFRNKISDQVEKLSLTELFNETILEFKEEITNSNINLSLEISDDLHLVSSPHMLKRIISNLVANAIQFRSKERDSIVSVFAKEKDKAIIIQVEDNGIGIDLSRNRDRIFDMYKKFHEGYQTKGLGLFIVKNLVEALGGTIEVESEVNKGSIFTIMLPNE